MAKEKEKSNVIMAQDVTNFKLELFQRLEKSLTPKDWFDAVVYGKEPTLTTIVVSVIIPQQVLYIIQKCRVDIPDDVTVLGVGTLFSEFVAMGYNQAVHNPDFETFLRQQWEHAQGTFKSLH